MSVAMHPSTSTPSTCTSNEKLGGEALGTMGVHTIFKVWLYKFCHHQFSGAFYSIYIPTSAIYMDAHE